MWRRGKGGNGRGGKERGRRFRVCCIYVVSMLYRGWGGGYAASHVSSVSLECDQKVGVPAMIESHRKRE